MFLCAHLPTASCCSLKVYLSQSITGGDILMQILFTAKTKLHSGKSSQKEAKTHGKGRHLRKKKTTKKQEG